MRPSGIEASKSKGELQVVWEDGHVSRYRLGALRAACPCAECRGGHQGMARPNAGREAMTTPVEGEGAELISIEAVGNYALLPVWGDGHRFGIYTWGYLRSLCPCGEHGA